ncbi:FMN-dependent NADH-azoreductase [Foetidibacter luteolus]|uniref:FMN-dependent NADH-azoreductase n=1 Tax=Foetidibacter luteolus TaxID=2608880 RepID=UPI001A983A3E|nr:NAD(P)H-dependent oxidoreductase [Foetidibacter luteolus]
MAKILSIQSSINGAQSVSRQLSAEIIEQLQNTYPGSVVIERDLSLEPVPHLGALGFLALRTPEQERTQPQSTAAAYADMLVKEVTEADVIVIAVPFYNFNIPSTLKSWLDHIAVPGKTFTYQNAAGVPEGLVKGKKVYLAIALGGVYSAEPMKAIDNTEPYLRSFLGFLGMKDVTVFRAEGMALPALREQSLQQALNAIDAYAY